MPGPSPDNLSYLLDETPNNFALTPGFLNPYPNGLFALGGNDFVAGSFDAELIYGDDGNDRLLGDAGSDTLISGSGNDFLIGGHGDDQLRGDTGNDILRGGQGDDWLQAFEGDDVLVGDKGRDILMGGEGADLFVLPTENAVQDPVKADIITDFEHFFWKNQIGLTGGLMEADLSLEMASLTPGSTDTLIRIRSTGAILGWVAGVSPDYLANRFVVADSKLGDELRSAVSLSAVQNSSTGFVGGTNPDDFYSFNIPVTSDVTLTVVGLSADADVALVKDLNGNNSIDAADIVQVSENSEANPENIQIEGLLPGNYFVRVYAFEKAETNYALSLSTTPSPNRPSDTLLGEGYDINVGYGLVNAAAAVPRGVGQSSYSDVPDLGGEDWGRDLIKAPEVWSQGLTGQGVVVAVVDSGVDYNHPDLAGNIWTNVGELGLDDSGRDKTTNRIDDDGNGFIDDFRGWDFVENDNDPMDENSHGTHVAGIIGAKRDGSGITGVAPDVTIMPVRTVNAEGVGKVINGVAGIRYAVDNGADVINVSFGGNDSEEERLAAIRYAQAKGVVVVAAAGNDGRGRPTMPARFADEVGIAVGSVDRNKNLSSFSNRAGVVVIDYVLAPGGNGAQKDEDDIYSTVPLSLPGVPYRHYFGTSMATPHVTGVVALMRQANPFLTPGQIEEIIAETANPTGITVS